MTEFILGAILLAGLAAGFVVYPWWRSDHPPGRSVRDSLTDAYRLRREELQEDVQTGGLAAAAVEEAEAELDHSLVADADRAQEPKSSLPRTTVRHPRRLAVFLAALVLAVGVGLFLWSSEQTRWVLFSPGMDLEQEAAREHERLLGQVEATPEDAYAWAALGRFYRNQGEGGLAVEAWQRANALFGYADPSALVEWADALGVAHQDRLPEEAVGLLLQALVIEPNHEKALWLAGWAAWQRGTREAAIGYWEQLLVLLDPQDGGVRAMVESWLAEVRGSASSASQSSPVLEVQVRVNEELSRRYEPQSTLFVYARHVEGPPMPLALWRGRADDLPLMVRLDDRAAMIAQMNLSQAQQVMVLARISRSGQAETQPGDLIGEVGPIPVESLMQVEVVIERVVR